MTSICFITFIRNFRHWLRGLLDNAANAVDEIVIVNGYSSNDVVDITKSYGVWVFSKKTEKLRRADSMFTIKQCNNAGYYT